MIIAQIPLPVVGLMPGHAPLGTQCIAASMFGMNAQAGGMVRNSTLLVDLINHVSYRRQHQRHRNACQASRIRHDGRQTPICEDVMSSDRLQ